MKQCTKCNEYKPFDQFYKHTKMADGLRYDCKDCGKRAARKYRLENDGVRERDRKRNREPERRARLNKAVELWRKKHPGKVAAWRTVSTAIQMGDMEKKPCEVCGTTRNIHAHHDDYSKPLDVRWLCALHHKRHHAAMERGST
jgi:hypothetical protein